MLFPLLAFLVGVLAAAALDYPNTNAPLYGSLVCLAVAAILYAFRGRFFGLGGLSAAIILVAIMLAGYWRAAGAHPPNDDRFFADLLSEGAVVGAEVQRIRPGENSIRLEVGVATVYKDAVSRSATGKLLVYLPPDIKTASVNVGDKIVFTNRVDTLRGPMNPGAFDSRAYWATQGIYHRSYVSDAIDWRHIRVKGWGLRARADRVRRAWFKSFQRYLKGDELAVASALIFGKKDLLSSEVRSAYSDTGAMHVLAVSGLHVGIILLIFRSIFLLLPYRKTLPGRVLETLITLVAIWGFAYVSGLSPSVRRAAIMFSIIASGRLVLRQTYLLNTLAGAALLMLWFEPGQVMQIGFQLSFMALVGIIWFATPLQRMAPGSHWPWSAIKGGVAASVGAQLGTIPVALYTFRTFPVYFMLSGSAVVIFAYLAMCLGLLHGAVYAIGGFSLVTDWTGWGLARVVELQNAFIYLFAQLPFGVLEFRSFTVWSALLSAATIFALAYYVNYRSRKALATALVLFALTVYSALPPVQRLEDEETVTVYHLRGKTLIDRYSSDGASAIGDELTPEDVTFNVAPNRKREGYEIDRVSPIDTTGSFQLGGRTWRVFDGKQPKEVNALVPSGKYAYVLVRNGYQPAYLKEADLPRDATIIVDGSNPPWVYEDWAGYAEDRGLDIWITGVRGAYVSSFAQ